MSKPLSFKDASNSPDSRGNKRARLTLPLYDRNPPHFGGKFSEIQELSEKKVSSPSNSFRNVSACKRCRLRKNRCDQQLPSCASCKKVGAKCVGYDPITQREIPRSYVFYLETRVAYLEKLLLDHKIEFAAAEVLDSTTLVRSPTNHKPNSSGEGLLSNASKPILDSHLQAPTQNSIGMEEKDSGSNKMDNVTLNVGNFGSINKNRQMGSLDPCTKSSISFARVVIAAVKSSVSGPNNEKTSNKSPPLLQKYMGEKSIRDSFFSLQIKNTSKQARFPTKEIGQRLVNFYFEYANPQLPILHRGEFMKMFESVYNTNDETLIAPKELYLLNIVFAIGSGIFLGGYEDEKNGTHGDYNESNSDVHQSQPEEYHAAAIVHLESFFSPSAGPVGTNCFGGGLEELQAVLLLAGFALLRPVPPGLWYIIGVAVRLAVDLGLHHEDGKSMDTGFEKMSDVFKTDYQSLSHEQQKQQNQEEEDRSSSEHRRREWIRDFRRRLWWCTYSFDRLVSTCVGRPVGITDQVITTEFPSLLDDLHITPAGFFSSHPPTPSYKYISYHYFRLRLLQSEILQVFQYRQAQRVRAARVNHENQFNPDSPPSAYLSNHRSFSDWRNDVDKRLWEWKTSAPTKNSIGVAFLIEYLDLNYWQCILLLYRQSLRVPELFEEMLGRNEEVQIPFGREDGERGREEEERIFLKIAEAGQSVLTLYRQLSRRHLVNYTYLATHHIIMAGISFLFAIWHSVMVRSRLTVDEVNSTIVAATSVLSGLIEKCPPADACRDALERMTQVTVKMCLSTTGFGSSTLPLESNSKSQGRAYEHQSQPHVKKTKSATENEIALLSQEKSEDKEKSELPHKTHLDDLPHSFQGYKHKLNSASISHFDIRSCQKKEEVEEKKSFELCSQDLLAKSNSPLLRNFDDLAPCQIHCPNLSSTVNQPEYTTSPIALSELDSILDPSLNMSHIHRYHQEYGYFPSGSSCGLSNLPLRTDYSNWGGWNGDFEMAGFQFNNDCANGNGVGGLDLEMEGKFVEGTVYNHDFNETGGVSDLFEGFFGSVNGVF